MPGRARGGVRFLVALRAATSLLLKWNDLGASGMDGLGARGELRRPDRGFRLIVAAGGAETDSGLRVFGVRMGGKWLWGLGLRGFLETCGWR
jgi:hypothetical protein